jgi:hypothetical protein
MLAPGWLLRYRTVDAGSVLKSISTSPSRIEAVEINKLRQKLPERIDGIKGGALAALEGWHAR